MATTTNYGWDTPDDTDLVKDGAAAIRTLGSSIDTTTKNLNPETTTGDIAYRSATANTNTRLAIGSTGQVLTVAAGVPSWAAPTGKVLQVVQDTDTSNFSTTNNSFTDTGLSVTITPSSASSKVFIIVSVPAGSSKRTTTTGDNYSSFNLVRTSTQLMNGYLGNFSMASSANPQHFSTVSMMYLDSPNTTSAITYKVQAKTESSTSVGYEGSATIINAITVMEIGA